MSDLNLQRRSDHRERTRVLSTRARFNATRLRLFETDQLVDSMRASNSWQLTAPLRWLQQHWPVLATLLIRTMKVIGWTVSGQLPRHIRAWCGSRFQRRSTAASTVLAQRQLPYGRSSFAWPETEGMKILVADESVPRPDQSAGERCTMAILEALRAEGWIVVFWPYDRADAGLYTRDLEALGIVVLDDRFYQSLEDFLKQHGASLDQIMIMRPHVAAALLPAVLGGSHAALSYQGHDLHFSRQMLEAAYKDNPDLTYYADRMQAIERAIWKVVDLVLYLSEDEVEMVRKLEPGVDARSITPYAFKSFVQRSTPTAGELILFVGGFAHAPNEDGVLWMAKHIMPRIFNSRPSAQIVIAGSNPTSTICALSTRRVEVTGHISDSALSALYDAARVAIVPLRYGAGVKGKVIEAMRAGVPVVTTSIGVQGMPDLPASVPVLDDPIKFADAVVELLVNDVDWLNQSTEQVTYVKARFSLCAMRASLRAALSHCEFVARGA